MTTEHRIDCNAARERIATAEGGALPGDDPSTREHLSGCASCRAYAEEQAALWELLGQLAPGVPAAGAGFTDRVLAAARRETWPRRATIVRFAALAAAACILVVVGSALLDGGQDAGDDDQRTAEVTAPPVESDPEGGDPGVAEGELGDLLADVPEEDRVVIALLHLSEDELALLGTVDDVDFEALEESSPGVGTAPTDWLALDLTSELNGFEPK